MSPGHRRHREFTQCELVGMEAMTASRAIALYMTHKSLFTTRCISPRDWGGLCQWQWPFCSFTDLKSVSLRKGGLQIDDQKICIFQIATD